MWGAGSGWLWEFLQTIILLVSLLAIFWQVRLQRLSNITSVLERLRNTWLAPAMSEGRHSLLVASAQGIVAVSRKEEAVLGFFEELGIYVRSRIIPARLAWEFFSYEVEHYWPVMLPFVTEMREQSRDKSYFTNSEYLYKKICKITKRVGTPFSATRDNVREFVQNELSEFADVPRP